jgi:hypothetical protein
MCLILVSESFNSGIAEFRKTRKPLAIFNFPKICLALTLWGMGGKLMFWPYSAVAMVIGCGLLAGMYFVIAIISLFKLFKGDRLNRGLRFLASATAVFMLSGILCKIQHWPFPEEYRIAGLALMAITIIYYFSVNFFLPQEKRKEWSFYNNIPGVLPYLFTAFIITSIHFWGWRAGFLPGFYSIEKPATWVALNDAESTPENDSRLDLYNNNLEIFWWIRNNQVFGIPVDDSTSAQLRNQFKTSPTDTTGKIDIKL